MRQYTTNRDTMPEEKKRRIDYILIILVMILLAFGLVMVYSSTAYTASVSSKYDNNPYYFFSRQVFFSVGGLFVMFFATFFPRKWIRKSAPFIYIVANILMFLVLTPLGVRVNGARRWIRLGIQIQPAEICKFAVIVGMAALVCWFGNAMKSRQGYWWAFILPAPLAVWALLFTKDLSSAAIIFLIGYFTLSIVHPNTKRVLIITAAGIAFLVLMVFLIEKFPDFKAWSFRGDRIHAWLNPEGESEAAFQTSQALYTIGSGGWVGKGIGRSVQKLGVLPEASNDMIFAVICEELGLFGAICIVGLYTAVIFRIWDIAKRAKDLFGALCVVGVMCHISVQVIFNMAVVTNTLPNTGISLPFISYGGSAILILMAEIGLVLNVGRDQIF